MCIGLQALCMDTLAVTLCVDNICEIAKFAYGFSFHTSTDTTVSTATGTTVSTTSVSTTTDSTTTDTTSTDTTSTDSTSFLPHTYLYKCIHRYINGSLPLFMLCYIYLFDMLCICVLYWQFYCRASQNPLSKRCVSQSSSGHATTIFVSCR